MKFHHLGIACKSIKLERPAWELLSYSVEGDLFSDPLQGVTGQFMVGPGPRVELLEPLNESSSLLPFISAGIKIYHQAYEACNFEELISQFKKNGALCVSTPKPSAYFDNRLVTFFMFKNMALVELIQSETNFNPPTDCHYE